MARLFLVRHGNTFGPGDTCVQVGSKTDLDLVESGRKQAESVASWLKEKGIEPAAIYAGPLKRHIQSSEIVAASFGLEFQSGVTALNEIDFGAWEGLTPEAIEQKFPSEYQAWKIKAEWQEEIFGGNFEDRLSEIRRWIKELSENFSTSDSVVAFSSGGNIRYFYSFIASEWRKLVRDSAVETLKVGTGRICELEIFPGSVKVLSWNIKPE